MHPIGILAAFNFLRHWSTAAMPACRYGNLAPALRLIPSEKSRPRRSLIGTYLLISDRAVIEDTVEFDVPSAQLGDKQWSIGLRLSLRPTAVATGWRENARHIRARTGSHVHRRSLYFPHSGDVTDLIQHRRQVLRR